MPRKKKEFTGYYKKDETKTAPAPKPTQRDEARRQKAREIVVLQLYRTLGRMKDAYSARYEIAKEAGDEEAMERIKAVIDMILEWSYCITTIQAI